MKNGLNLTLLLLLCISCNNSTRDKLENTVNEIVYDSIKEIVENPTDYEGKTVTIKGKVGASTNIQIVKYYYVTDEENEIMVFTKSAVPLDGVTVVVKGKVSQLLKIDDTQVTSIKEISRDSE